MEKLDQYIESLIFVAQQPISAVDIRYTLENTFESQIPDQDVEMALTRLKEKYQQDHFAIEIVEIAEGYQFLTKAAFHHVIGSYLKLVTKKKLSRVALETLAIIAYKQPVTKSELEKIRGVNCDYSIQKLLDKELVEISGRSDGPGKPLLYVTSPKFMNYFGLKDLTDLPKLKDFHIAESQIGEPAPIEEMPNEDQQ